MNTQIKVQPVVVFKEETMKGENPMQERIFVQVAESVPMTAEAILLARMHEDQGEVGPLFVP